MAELVLVRRDGPVALLILNRPHKLNALSSAVEENLDAALEAEEVRDSRVVILSGQGGAFCAGADMTEMGEATPDKIIGYYRRLGDVYERVARLPQPSIAAIHGYCLGGGFELVLACDFRIADRSAVFGLPEVPIGILPSSGGTHRLVRAVGVARAKELILLRRRVDASEALRLGVLTELVDQGAATGRAMDLARELAELPPLAVEVAKRATEAMAESSRDAGLLVERFAYGLLSQTEEHARATRSFGEGAAPDPS
ncbi:MAG TPA: enoyl-CoA hydratase/isomerase family protein [Actinomycetota bacterium]|jgi:enoyl-CoA hydratase/carnithine racemase|nr:enoyl-CoA hydratase/isomerase family protein [Actinomycetota bacterium]